MEEGLCGAESWTQELSHKQMVCESYSFIFDTRRKPGLVECVFLISAIEICRPISFQLSLLSIPSHTMAPSLEVTSVPVVELPSKTVVPVNVQRVPETNGSYVPSTSSPQTKSPLNPIQASYPILHLEERPIDEVREIRVSLLLFLYNDAN